MFAENSLKILRPKSLEKLSLMLNDRKILANDNGSLRDYRGLAEIAKLDRLQMKRVENSPDHVKEIIVLWCRQNDTTVQHLVSGLEEIGRYDVVSDVENLLIADCEAAMSHGIDSIEATTTVCESALTFHDIEEIRRGGSLVKYDAIILHGDDEIDEAFAWHLAERLDLAGKKVFLPQRDLIAGTIEHAASVDIIDKRCEKVILVLSPSFFESQTNKFYTAFAKHVELQNTAVKRSPKLVPINFRHCSKEKIDAIIRMCSALKYDPQNKLVNFYKRLLCGSFNVHEKHLTPQLLEYPQDYRFINSDLQKIKDAKEDSSKVNKESILLSKVDDKISLNSISSSQLNSTQTTLTCVSLNDVLPQVPDHEPLVDEDKPKKSKPLMKKLKDKFKKDKIKN